MKTEIRREGTRGWVKTGRESCLMGAQFLYETADENLAGNGQW